MGILRECLKHLTLISLLVTLVLYLKVRHEEFEIHSLICDDYPKPNSSILCNSSYLESYWDKKNGCHLTKRMLDSLYDGLLEPRFQRIIPAPELLFTYSAFFEPNDHYGLIRIIALGRVNENKILYCNLYDENYRFYFGVKGRAKSFHDDDLHVVFYRSGFIFCYYPKQTKKPTFISINAFHHNDIQNNTNTKTCKITNILKVHYPPNNGTKKPKYETVACVKPMFSYNNTFALLEWVEFNRLMGVEHFTIYIYSIDKRSRCAAAQFPKNIEIRDWNPPIRDNPKVLRNGMVAALNDCLYKYKNLAKYILFSDLDEFIVPNFSSNFTTMINSIDRLQGVGNSSTVGYYKFMNGFFFKCWPDFNLKWKKGSSRLVNKILKNMVTMRKTKLTQPFYNPSEYHFENRTKYIAQTANSIEAGVHYMWERVNGSSRIDVNEKIAYSHHYRVNLTQISCSNSSSVVEDKTAHRYGLKIARNLSKKMLKIAEICK